MIFPYDWYKALNTIRSICDQSQYKTSNRFVKGDKNIMSDSIVCFLQNSHGVHFEVSTGVFMNNRIVGLTAINADGSIDIENGKCCHTTEELEEHLENAGKE